MRYAICSIQKLLLILPSVLCPTRNRGLEALGEHTVMEIFLIVLAVIAGTGVAFFLFVIEPRRKIYDYDPRDYDPRDPR